MRAISSISIPRLPSTVRSASLTRRPQAGFDYRASCACPLHEWISKNWRSDEQKLKIHFMPGEKWMYSGEGYNYLQTVVTAVLGIPFEVYMDTYILKPFLMFRAVISQTGASRSTWPGGMMLRGNYARIESQHRKISLDTVPQVHCLPLLATMRNF